MSTMRFGIVRALVAASMLFLGQLRPAQAGGGLQYMSPRPGSDYNPAGTTVAVRYDTQLSPQDVNDRLLTVTGTTTGRHTGKVVLSDDQQTLIFKPDWPFAEGETVDVTANRWTAVRLRPGFAGGRLLLQYHADGATDNHQHHRPDRAAIQRAGRGGPGHGGRQALCDRARGSARDQRDRAGQ